MRYLLILVMLVCGTNLKAQEILNAQGLTALDAGIDALKDGKYLEADVLFREALDKIRKLPSKLVYYFGRNSYHLEKHKQAINWLNKYIELKGTKGQFYAEAVQYLDLANKAFLIERQKEVVQTEVQQSNDGWIDCPHDRVLCPVCKGSGVLITPGKFGALYQTCPYSGSKGTLTCEEYNLYLRGELEERKLD